MLRNFIHNPDGLLLSKYISQFDIEFSESSKFVLISFQIISPDSFLWRCVINDAIYYLYAEDFVEGLDDVRSKIQEIHPHPKSLEFLPATQIMKFEDTQPFKSSTLYSTPKNVEVMMRHTVESGIDFVFLCKSDDDVDDAFFI